MRDDNQKPNFYDLYQKVGNIEGTLESFIIKADKCIDNHEIRINCIEKSVDHMEGRATAIGAIAGFIVSIIAIVISFLKKDVF